MAKEKNPPHKVVMTEGENESAKFWLNALNELKNRRVKGKLGCRSSDFKVLKECPKNHLHHKRD